MRSSQETAKKLTGAAGIVIFGTLLSRITGFLRYLLITTIMKHNGYSDEFLLAFNLPNLIYDLLAGGAIAAALIPILTNYLAKGNEKTGWKAVNTFMNLTIIVMVVLEVIFFAFTEDMLGFLAPGYNNAKSGINKEQLIGLTRILLLSAPFMMMAGQFNGILNSYKRFVVAAMGPVIYNIFTVISIAIFGSVSAELTSWGIVFAAFVFFIIQLAGTFKHLTLYKPRLYIRSEAFKKLFIVALPSLISSAILEINIIISKSFATYFEEGMLTLLNAADRTWQLPLGIFAQSIGIALLPTLSEHHASDNHDEFKNIMYKGLRVVFLLSLPTSLIMMILNQDIMRILFKWGKFSEYDVFFAGVSLIGYASALVFASAIALMVRSFYAIHDSKTPLFSGIINILAVYALNAIFRNFTNLGIAGTALAYSIASFINLMILLVTFKKKTGIDVISDNFGYMVKAVCAAVPAGLVTFLIGILVRPDVTSKLSQILAIILPVSAGLGGFWILATIFKIPEIKFISNLVISRFKK